MQKKYPYFTLWLYMALLINRIVDNKIPRLPHRLGKYKLEKNLKESENFSFGIYSDGKSDYFAKVWRGKILDINYYNLKNESRVIEMLKSKIFSKRKQEIFIPYIHDTIEQNNLFAVFYPYIKGRRLTSYNKAVQKRVMEKVIGSVGYWSNFISRDKSIKAAGVSPILSLPFYTLILCINEPKKSKEIIKTAAASWLWFYKNRSIKKVFMHGDLSPDNIINTNGKIWLIDWEEAGTTFPNFDLNYLAVTQSKDFWMRSINKVSKKQINKHLQTYIALRQAFFNLRNPGIKNQLMNKIYV